MARPKKEAAQQQEIIETAAPKKTGRHSYFFEVKKKSFYVPLVDEKGNKLYKKDFDGNYIMLGARRVQIEKMYSSYPLSELPNSNGHFLSWFCVEEHISQADIEQYPNIVENTIAALDKMANDENDVESMSEETYRKNENPRAFASEQVIKKQSDYIASLKAELEALKNKAE